MANAHNGDGKRERLQEKLTTDELMAERAADAARRTGSVPPGRESHPRGLWVLFITEMWERFSYYGMRALLVLFLVTTTSKMLADGKVNDNPGFGWSEADSYVLYGIYTFMAYFGSIFGGVLADRMLGTHRSMLIGGWFIAAGHIALAVSGFFGFEPGPAVSMENGAGTLTMFLLGLSLIIIGTGLFKPCVSVMVGQLYGEGDARRDSGFTIFYMGINLGAFFSPLVAGTLGEKIGWHWGFGSAAVGMLLGLFFYQVYRPKYLKGIGDPPPPSERASIGLFSIVFLALIALPILPLVLYATGQLGHIADWWGKANELLGLGGMWGVGAAIVLGLLLAFVFAQPKRDRGPLGVIIILAFLGNIFFWTAFEQAGSSLNIFALDNTDRTLWGMVDDGFPASWYQSINPLAILIFGPLFAWLWVWLNRRRLDPSTPMKFSIGLWLLGLGFLAMVFGSMQARGDNLAGPYWLLIVYLVSTWGELCLSPVGLSMVTKLAPERLQSQMMGFWWITMALSNLCAGLVAKFSTQVESGEVQFIIDGLPGFFLMLVVCPIAMGFVILILTPLLKRMMHGVH